MRTKKFRNNEYVLEQGVWVRNPFCGGRPLDLNSMAKSEASMILENESLNIRSPHMQMDDNVDVSLENVVIASDGYDWGGRQMVLASISNKDAKVIGVNGSLAKWKMVGEEAAAKRTMTLYLVNNPYPECMGYLPRRHRYYPNIVASTRTYPKFLSEYKSQPYLYKPTPDLDYSGAGRGDVSESLDDYRNPVCAAISLAVRKGAKKIVLLCCDESFEDERPGSERMKNGLFQYPQQIKCQKIIDRQIYWLRRAGIMVADCSSGIELENAEYINPEGLVNFLCKEGNV